MDVERVAIDSVRTDAGNVRKHGKKNLDTIQRSLEAFGQQKPIVVGADGVVVAGNGTLDAARALGWTHIDVVRTGLEGSARKAYAVADNRTAELAEWDDTGLAEYLAGLKADETFDETLTGFDAGEIERLIGAPEVVEDETPAVPETAITQPGDLWLLGDHRVLCGDCVDWFNHELADSVDVTVTSPPYNTLPVENNPSGMHKGNKWVKKAAEGYADSMPEEAYQCWLSAIVGTCLRLSRGLVWINHKVRYRDGEAVHPVRFLDMPIYAEVIWDRGGSMALNCKRYAPSHEGLWAFGKPHYWNDEQNTHMSVWRLAAQRSTEHTCPFPVMIASRPIASSCPLGGLVLEPFLGAGTTLIAAEQLGRKCYGIEIEPKYVDVTLKRWANLTGKQPIREADGKTFAELSVDKS